MTITSPHSEALKEVRKLAGRRWRDKLQRFVAEGEDLLAAADAAGWEPVARYAVEGGGLAGVPVHAAALARVSQLGSGTRALAVYAQKWAPAPAGPLCLALWGVADPGNVGTALRAAHAFGAASVALGPGTADPYGHKAVRASMGAVFQVPLVRVRDLGNLPRPRIALVARAGTALAEALATAAAPAAGAPAGAVAGAGTPGSEPLAATSATLVVGAEREGLPAEVEAACDARARIAMAGAAESLNAAMAATVALYEATRMPRR